MKTARTSDPFSRVVTCLCFLFGLLGLPFVESTANAASPFVGWGSNLGYGTTTSPAAITNAVAFSCGAVHNLVIRSNRTVVAWGYNGNDRTNVPAGLMNVITVAGGGTHSLALRSNGTVVAWGGGTTLTGSWPEYGQSIVPANLSNVVAVACGGYHSLALKSNGMVTAWGQNLNQQASVPAGLTNVVAVAGGAAHSLALRSDGSVVAWGDNASGQTQVPSGLRNVFSITAGGSHSLALKAEGTVVAWGNGYDDRTNVPPDLTNVVAIAAGADHSLALRADGTVISWGYYAWGQTNTPAGLSNVVALGGGSYHSLVLLNHGPPVVTTPEGMRTVTGGSTVWLWIPHGGEKPLSYQWRLNGTNLPSATNAALVLTDVQLNQAGRYSLAVSNALGGTSSSDLVLKVIPLAITLQPKSPTTFPGATVELAVKAVGAEPISYQWQLFGTNLIAATNATLVLPAIQSNQTGVYAAVISNSFGALISDAGTVSMAQVVAWGDDQFSQASVPPGLSNIVSVSAGADHCLVLKRDGTVTAWGRNNYGQADVPAELTNVVAISAGDSHNIVLNADGSLFAWGRNSGGLTSIPEGLTNVIAIEAGGGQNVALLANGKMFAWGTVYYAGLTPPSNVVAIAAGDATSEGVNILALTSDNKVFAPSSVGEVTVPAAVSVSAGFSQALVLQGDGTVVALGDVVDVPPDLTNVLAVAAGDFFNLALRTDGTVTSWGRFDDSNTNLPPGLSNVTAIASGRSHGLALLGEGPPFIISALAGRKVIHGATNWLYVQATGAGPLHYQWCLNGTNLPSATNAFLTLDNIGFAQAGLYSVVVSNPFGVVTNSNLLLQVVPLVITRQPEDQSTYIGGTAVFEVVADSTEPLSYQWQFNGTNLPGATESTLTLTNVQLNQSGWYAVVVSNPLGELPSGAASLSVGRVVCWGEPYAAPGLAPDLTNVIAITHGYGHALALNADGTVVAWGSDYDGQASGPNGFSNCIAIAAGAFHSLALRNNGTVAAWGYNSRGQVNVPSGLANVVAIAAGAWNSIALKADGTVVAWGTGAALNGLSSIVAIAGGSGGNFGVGLALGADGTLISWGETQGIAPPANIGGLVALDGGYIGGLGLKADGTVVPWGSNNYGQTNLPASLSNVVAITRGDYHNLALQADGSVIGWGSGDIAPPITLANVAAVAAGGNHSLALLADGPPAVTVPLISFSKTTNFSVVIPTRSGKVYRLEYTDSLQDPAWTAQLLVAGNGAVQTLTGPDASNSQRFYRVRSW